jgi:rubrerythrin
MTRLEAEPPMPVRSLEELLAIGHAIKAEAANRYAELAERMHALSNESVAAVFRRLSHDAHEDVLTFDLRARERLGKSPDPTAMRWALPKTCDEEAAGEMSSSRLLTPYRALSLAVRDAEGAFIFWSYLAAEAKGAEVRQLAEAIAQQELDHVASLRRERRKAYHTEHPPIHPGASKQFQGDVETSIAALERRMAEMLRHWATEVGEPTSTRLLVLADQSSAMAETTLPAHSTGISIPVAIAKSTVQPLALAELLVERYLDAAEHQPDEVAMARAQSLAARAIDRFAWLRSFQQA